MALRSLLNLSLGGALLVAGSVAADPASANPPSLWRVLERLLAQDMVRPEQPSAAAGPVAERRHFLFDDALKLSPDAILRGAEFIVAKNPPPTGPEAEVAHARRVEAQLQALFEYYPLIAQSSADFDRLTDAIANGAQPAAFRRFLLRRCAPDPELNSSLATYMQACLAGGNEGFEADLMALVQNPTEVPDVQYEAVRVLWSLLDNTFKALLAQDPRAVEFQQKNKVPLNVRDLIGAPDAIPLTRPNQLKIEERAQVAGNVAALLLAAARDPARSPEMRTRSGETASTILANVPVPNRETLQPRAEQRPPVTLQAAPVP